MSREIHVTLDLTLREADELLRADIHPRNPGDGVSSVKWELERATSKLHEAIDRAHRG